MKKNFQDTLTSYLMKSPILKESWEEGGLTHILVAVCNASTLHSREYLHSFSFSQNFREKKVKSMMEENDWQPKKHVENKCENGRYGAPTTKLICYASLVFTSVYTFTCLGLSIRPYLYSFWFIALVSLLPGGLIQLWNLTRISQSIVTKCHSPITILFHWAGLGL